MIITIPLSNDPAQRMTVQLGRVRYEFYVKFNSRSSVWTFDLSIPATDQILMQSIPIVLGADVLLPYNLGIGRLLAGSATIPRVDATAEDLGARIILVWFSPEEG